MESSPKTKHVHVNLPAALVERIDAHVDGQRCRNRTDAVIDLLLRGLAAAQESA